MIAEIYHKFSTDLEDVLTGDFFGAMRYMPFNRGLNQIFKNYAVSEDPQVTHILSNAADDDFNSGSGRKMDWLRSMDLFRLRLWESGSR